MLDTAGTKWNFLKFNPGLVGGHCIGVDPYYLTHKAESIGYSPKIILAGRSLNDSMGEFVASELESLMRCKEIDIKNSQILVLGFAFKEDCPDHRNTKVIDLINSLKDTGAKVDCYDHMVDKVDVKNEYNIDIIDEISNDSYDAILVAVAHSLFVELGSKKIRKFGKKKHILYDLKSIYTLEESEGRL